MFDPRDYDRDDARHDQDLDTLDRHDDHPPDWRDRADGERDDDRHDDRERYGRDRDRDKRDPRDVFMRDLDLPRGDEREIVRDRDREYRLRGSESRSLSTVGSFRVVRASDLRDHDGRPADPRRAPKTVNNVLTVLNTMLKKAVEWELIERVPCGIRLLPVPPPSARFHDFDDLESG